MGESYGVARESFLASLKDEPLSDWGCMLYYLRYAN